MLGLELLDIFATSSSHKKTTVTGQLPQSLVNSNSDDKRAILVLQGFADHFTKKKSGSFEVTGKSLIFR